MEDDVIQSEEPISEPIENELPEEMIPPQEKSIWDGDDDVPAEEDADPVEEPVAAPVADIPEKFKGKSPEEIITMYRNLESDYTRKSQVLSEYEKQQAQPAQPEQPAYDEETMRCMPVARAEYDRLLNLGFDEDQAQNDAWAFARQQDAYIQQAITQGIQAQLGPVQQLLAPQFVTNDVKSVLQQTQVEEVTPEEVAQAVQAQFPLQAWIAATPQEKAFVTEAIANRLALQKLRGKAAEPSGPAPQVPPNVGVRPQGKPASNPQFERQVSNLMNTMGLTRQDAEAVLKG